MSDAMMWCDQASARSRAAAIIIPAVNSAEEAYAVTPADIPAEVFAATARARSSGTALCPNEYLATADRKFWSSCR